MKLTGAQILIETLLEQGTDTVFGYPGGAVLDIYDELYKNSDRINHIISAHEQGAVHAADGYARTSGKVGVVISTSGPGATNLVTGIANAYLDSVPLVAITGNVSNALIGRDSFQEVDIVGITLPVTKHNYVVKKVEDLAGIIREAMQIAKTGRPGPVLIDIPKDIQVSQTEYSKEKPYEISDVSDYTEEDLLDAVKMINDCEKPYIYCGGGVITASAGDAVLELAERIDAPIGFSMMGLSAVSSDSPRALGMSGMHGRYSSTKAKYDADLIIAVGVRFSDRATGDKSRFAKKARIIHIDIDPAEIDKNITADLGITGNVKSVLEEIIKRVNKSEKPEWKAHIAELKKYEDEHAPNILRGDSIMHPYRIIDMVRERANDDTPIVTDVGQHQMWTAQRYRFGKARTFVSSGGLGTMGFGMGAAIGSCVATGKRTVLFTGDGSFGMNLNEMATVVSQNLPVVIVIMNNGVLGMVRQWQTKFYNKHYSQTTLNRKTDFVALAEAFGARGIRVFNESDFSKALDEAFSADGPVLIDCAVDKDEFVYPMIPPNGSIENLMLN